MTARPRLLIMSPTPARGGAEEYLLSVAAAAADIGWEVTVALELSPRTRSIADELRATPVHFLAAPVRGGHRWGAAGQMLAAISVLLRVRPAVAMIVVPWPTLGVGCVLAAALCRVPAAVVFQLAPRPVAVGRWRALCRRARRRQRWIAVSAQNAAAIAQTFELGCPGVEIIPNGGPDPVADDPPRRANAHRALREELGLPAQAWVVITVGRLDLQKGHDDLLQAIPAVVTTHPDTFFVWVGDGDRRAELERRVATTGLAARVRILGHRADVDQLLLGADLFVLPSHFEGLPFSLLEALAHGVPVLSSDAGGSPEVVRDGIDGLIHRRADPDHLAQRLDWAVSHRDDLRHLARAGRTRAATFSRTRMLESTMAALDVLGGRGGRSLAPPGDPQAQTGK